MGEQQVIVANPVGGSPPARKLKTNRGLAKLILLSMITFGIYGLIVYSALPEDLNQIASRHDGRKSMNFWLLLFIIGPITLGIGTIVWMHNMCDRIGHELKRRGLPHSFDASQFWILGVLLGFTLVCPLIFVHNLLKSMNKLSEHYNVYG